MATAGRDRDRPPGAIDFALGDAGSARPPSALSGVWNPCGAIPARAHHGAHATLPQARNTARDAVAPLGAPPGWLIEGLPEPVDLRRRAGGRLDVILAFSDRRAKLARRLLERRLVERRLAVFVRALRAGRGACGSRGRARWPVMPARSARTACGRIVLPTGLVDTKVAALDEDWSGLKFVWRREIDRLSPSDW